MVEASSEIELVFISRARMYLVVFNAISKRLEAILANGHQCATVS